MLVALCGASFLGTLVYASLAPFFPDIARDLATEVPLLGQAVTARLVLSAAFGLVAGPLADGFGHRRVMVVGMVAAALTLVGTGLAPSYLLLLVTSLPAGLAGAILGGVALAIAGSRFTGEARRRAVSWVVAALSSAPIVGVPLMTTLGSWVGWRAAFVVAGTAALGTTWLVARGLPRDPPRAAAPLRGRDLVAAYRPLLRDRTVLRLYGVTALRAAGWLGLLTYYGAFLADEVGLDTRAIGLAYMVGGSGYFLGSLVAGGRLGRFPPVPLVAATNLAMGLLTLLILEFPVDPVLVVALTFVLAFAGALGWVAFTTLLAATTRAGAATTMGLNGSILNLGAAAGGAGGALLLSVGGYRALGLGLPLFAVAAAALVLEPRRRSLVAAERTDG